MCRIEIVKTISHDKRDWREKRDGPIILWSRVAPFARVSPFPHS